MKARILSISIPAICMIGTFLLLIGACQKPRTPSEPDPDPQPTWVADTTLIPQIINRIDSNRIRNTIQTLQDFGTRYNYDPRCYQAAQWIKAELESYGYDVEYQTYFPNVHRFYDIEFVSENVGCMVGEGSLILMTRDGGQTWEVKESDSYIYFNRTYFLDEQYGWVWKDNGYFNSYSTKDGGETWDKIGSLFYEPLSVVYFLNRKKGWFGAVSGKLFFTENGGDTWIRHGSNFDHITELYFLSNDVGWLSDYNKIYKTDDGGQTWTALDFERDVKKIRFYNDRFGLMIGQNGILKITRDGGDEWVTVLSQHRIIDFDILSETRIVAVGPGYFLSEDGGTTWQEYLTERRYTDIAFRNELEGVMTGYQSPIMQSPDGGKNWLYKREGLPPEVYFHNIKAVKHGKIHRDRKYIIGAHYDSYIKEIGPVGAPGANDNASGTAGVLEIARLLRDHEFDYTIEFILFSGEEVGLQGSRYAAQYSAVISEDIRGMINMDMIGYCPVGDIYDFNIMSLDVEFRSSFIRGASIYTDIIYYTIDDNSWDDKAYYINGYSALSVFEDDRYPALHYPWDTIDKLNLDYASEIIRFTMGGLLHFLQPVVEIDGSRQTIQR